MSEEPKVVEVPTKMYDILIKDTATLQDVIQFLNALNIRSTGGIFYETIKDNPSFTISEVING